MTNETMEALLQNLASLFRHYRMQCQMTQMELADRAGVSLRTYQRIENGDAEPSLSIVYRLSTILGFRFEEVLKIQEKTIIDQNLLPPPTKFFENVIQVARVGGWELDLARNELYWNEVTRWIHEVPEKFKPTPEQAIVFFKGEENRSAMRAALERCRTSGDEIDLQLPMVTAKGKEIVLNIRGKAVKVNDKINRIIGTFQDITNVVQDKRSLSDMLERLEDVTDNAKVGVWELVHSVNHLSWSKTLYSIFEIDPEKFEPSYEGFLKLVHPEDRELVHHAYTKSLQTREPYEIVHRLVMPDGRLKWVAESCITTFSDEGKPIASFGCSLDITRYKLFSEKLG